MSEIKHRGWIGVDLDGTLAKYTGWNGGEIGEPVPEMLERVKRWQAEGIEVRIVTARVACCGRTNEFGQPDDERFASEQRDAIGRWCVEHGLGVLPVTASKDFAMVALWDDRAVAVEVNTGRVLNEETIRIAYNLELLERLGHGDAVRTPGDESFGGYLIEGQWDRGEYGLTVVAAPFAMPLAHAVPLLAAAIRGGATVVKAGGR